MISLIPADRRRANYRLRHTVLNVKRNWGLLLLFLPTLIYIIVFRYLPMGGILIAFKDYKPSLGIFASPWADHYGLKYFIKFFSSYNFLTLITNTLRISLYSLIASFPFPILFALLLNSLPNKRFRKVVQTVTYAPHFISMVVMVGMLYIFLTPSSGLVNIAIRALGGKTVMFLNSDEMFPHVYVWSGIWQHFGWDSILYIAALANVSPELHEAAIVDGASKWQRIRFIDFPSILPTAIIMLILNTGSVMSVGFEKAYLLQNSMNLATSEVLSTYVYKVGLLNSQFSLSTAMGLFNSVVNFGMLVLVNMVSKKVSGSSLW